MVRCSVYFESGTRSVLKDLLTDWKGTKDGFKVFLALPTGRLELFQTKRDSTVDQILGEDQANWV